MLSVCAAGCSSRAKPVPEDRARPLDPVVAPVAASAAAKPVRARLDGRGFPDRVLALTWDDGPDARTVELARFLHERHVAATFFVVAAWDPGLSEEPGKGTHVFETGYEALPVLDEVASLGHRIANHTKNHVLLGSAPAATVLAQLVENQRGIDRFARGDLRLFRAPGGAWSDAASLAIDADPWASTFVGPVHWDVDGKDWEGSLYCKPDEPAAACERAAPDGAARVKPDVIAARYVSLAATLGHGIVLFHDRVGHVGSDYALRVAKIVVPELAAKGFVFAPAVLRFSSLRRDADRAKRPPRAAPPAGADLAALFGQAVPSRDVQVGDVDGDGRQDLCARIDGAVVCALATGSTGWTKAERWSRGGDLAGASTVRLGDLNGDGRADVCGLGAEGVVCALSDGHGFLGGSVWIGPPALSARADAFELVDVNGDGRADACGEDTSGPVCALAP